jgi:hypothetical protein
VHSWLYGEKHFFDALDRGINRFGLTVFAALG